MADDRRGGGRPPRKGPKPATSGRKPPRGGGRPAGSRAGAGGRGGRPDGPHRTSGPDGERRSEDRPPRDTSNDLPWPEEIFELELDDELRAELDAAGGPTPTLAKHLLSVQVLSDDDPEAAYQHATRLRDRLPRSALARQTACIAAYRAGHFREAIKEESAYRRLGGKTDLLPIAADSERGLARPQRALALLAEFDGPALESDTRTELLIVAAGARQDLGDADAARVLAQKAVRAARSPMASARARYALGRHLAAAGDAAQARKWLTSAVELDEGGIWTDAAEVLETL
jgi:tetratricopeptide (TPR) repeat protein